MVHLPHVAGPQALRVLVRGGHPGEHSEFELDRWTREQDSVALYPPCFPEPAQVHSCDQNDLRADAYFARSQRGCPPVRPRQLPQRRTESQVCQRRATFLWGLLWSQAGTWSLALQLESPLCVLPGTS